MEKAPSRAIFLLKAPTSAFTFKNLLLYYAKQVHERGKYSEFGIITDR